MGIEVEEIINACEIIARQDQLDVCITESFKGAVIAGAGAFVCGVLMGPVGVAVGGTLGGLAGSSFCRYYRPLWQILSEMSAADRNKLTDHMQKTLEALEISDAMLLMAIVSNPTHAARDTIVKELISYFGGAIAQPQRPAMVDD